MTLSCQFQVVEDGYEFFAKRQLVTLFSAPNYCGEFDNAGAMMSVDETLMCSFQILKVGTSKLLEIPPSRDNGPKTMPPTLGIAHTRAHIFVEVKLGRQ